MAYPPTHPLSVVAQEFGYSNAASLQAVCHSNGYKAGWDNLRELRAFVKQYKAGRTKGGEGKAKASRAGPALALLASQIYPDLKDRDYARNKARQALKAAKYRGDLNNLEAMRAALAPSKDLLALPTPQPATAAVPTAEAAAIPSQKAIEQGKQAVKIVSEVRSILERIEMLYHGVPRRRSDPLLGLCDYALGITRGDVPV